MLDNKNVGALTNYYCVGGPFSYDELNEILSGIEWNLVKEGWNYTNSIVVFERLSMYFKDVGRMTLSYNDGNGEFVISFSNGLLANLPYGETLIEGIDLREYLRTLPML